MSGAKSFGQLLRERRLSAGISQAALARASGLSRGTIANLEESRTEPAGDTRLRLARVAALRLSENAAEHARPAAEPWFSPRYDPLDMAKELEQLVNGPGGTLEQTYVYIDGQSAVDWYNYANLPAYVENFRQKFPVTKIADAALGQRISALDQISLGVGDGMTETRLAQQLAERLPEPPDLRVYLLDISHPLLVEAYKQASAGLPSTVPVFPVHGNFLDLRSIIPLAYRATERPRLWTMIGNTFGNLTHEPHFLADLAACARPGDLLLLDVQLVWADARDLDAIRTVDPAFVRGIPDEMQTWLAGPVYRHCRTAQSVKLTAELTNRCPMPGSYQLNFIANVRLSSGVTLNHHLFLVRRYDLEMLAAELRDLGWRTMLTAYYGPEPAHMGCLLLERM